MNKLKYIKTIINHQFEKKETLLIFLLILIGVILPSFSGSYTTNIWYRLHKILTNPFFNALFFIAIGLNIIYASNNLLKNNYILNRLGDFKKIVKKNIKDITILTIFLILIATILASAGAIAFSFGDYNIINHETYLIPLPLYSLWHILKLIIISVLVNKTIYLLLILWKKIGAFILIIIINLIFFTPINTNFLYHTYILNNNFTSLNQEIIFFIIEIIALYLIYKTCLYITLKKKREL